MSAIRRTVVGLAALLLTTACGRGSGEEFVEALPQLEGVTLEVTGDASEGAVRIAEDGVSHSAVTSSSEYLSHARDGVRRVNGIVREMLGQVREVANTYEPVRVNATTVVYGPHEVGNVSYRLFVRRISAGAFGWRVDAKPLGAEDTSYLRVMGGAVQNGASAPARRGAFGVNLDNLKLVDPSFPGEGVLLAGYANRDGNKTLAYRLKAFTPDANEYAALSAAFVGHRRADTGRTHVKLAHGANVDALPNATDAKELLRLRASYVPGVGGRAAMLATGGDIAEGEAYVGVACWDAGLVETFKLIRHCTGVGTGSRTCETVEQVGQAIDCRQEVGELEEPALDPMDGALDEDAPDADVTAPDSEPTGDIEG